jgi:hypothetical protein
VGVVAVTGAVIQSLKEEAALAAAAHRAHAEASGVALRFDAPQPIPVHAQIPVQPARHPQAGLRRQFQDPQTQLPTKRCVTQH